MKLAKNKIYIDLEIKEIKEYNEKHNKKIIFGFGYYIETKIMIFKKQEIL